jgi:hypothetical protein
MNYRCDPLASLIVATTFALAACAETYEASYATTEEAQSAGAVARGWVPKWLPANATSIREVHNLDTNNFMLRFAVPKGTALQPPKPCERVALDVPSKPPFRRAWWPSDVPASGLATHRHVFFGCDRTFVAYSAAQGEGFVWRAE